MSPLLGQDGRERSLGFHCYCLLIWWDQPLPIPLHELRTKAGQFHQSFNSFNPTSLSCFLKTSLSERCRPGEGRGRERKGREGREGGWSIGSCSRVPSHTITVRSSQISREYNSKRPAERSHPHLQKPSLLCFRKVCPGQWRPACHRAGPMDEQPTPSSRKQQNAPHLPTEFLENELKWKTAFVAGEQDSNNQLMAQHTDRTQERSTRGKTGLAFNIFLSKGRGSVHSREVTVPYETKLEKTGGGNLKFTTDWKVPNARILSSGCWTPVVQFWL